MVSRLHRARFVPHADPFGAPQLTLAHIILLTENLLKYFARPLMTLGVFVLLAWFGLFQTLFPWAHLALLALFVLYFSSALGRSRAHWKKVPAAHARRRVEEASGLSHRPLDVLDDQPILVDEAQRLAWQSHVAQAKRKTQQLRWPTWRLSFADRDPYALRYALIICLMVAAIFGWGALGGRVLTAMNPQLGKMYLAKPALDAWITPPDYTKLPPIMIATPAGARKSDGVIEIPEGSVITAHLAEPDEDVPTLVVNDDTLSFAADGHQGFGIQNTIHQGDKLSIRRGWQELGSWRIRVVPDQAPEIAFTSPPSITERKSVRLDYEAKDDFSLAAVSVRITPRETLPGTSSDPMEIELTTPETKQIKRASFEDLTSHPWAGLPVQMELIATDALGHKTVSQPAEITLPERLFFQPVARALIEERKKLLQNPYDDGVRNEAANIMAGVAQQPGNYRNDAVVMMALRSGAVRLVLGRTKDLMAPVLDILWQTAVRIEDGTMGVAEENLTQAQKELAEAFDHKASESTIQTAIDRLHQALRQYLAELANKLAARPGPLDDLSALTGSEGSSASAQDLEQMLAQMRSLSAAGSREAARQQLAQLEQFLQNLRTERPELTDEQKKSMKELAEIRQLTRDQQRVLDQTYQNAQGTNRTETRHLTQTQAELYQRLIDLIAAAKQDNSGLSRGAQEMKAARDQLQVDAPQSALVHQNEALRALQDIAQSMSDNLRSSMMVLPAAGMQRFGEKADPFGHSLFRDDGTVKVPDQMQVKRVREILDELQRRVGDQSRSKTERDYIERLLQNY